MGIDYENRHCDYDDSFSRSSYGGRKCACCFRFGCVLLVIETVFAIVSSFILVKEFVMSGRHTDILGKDLLVAYVLRDQEINITFENSTVIVYNYTETDNAPPSNPTDMRLLSTTETIINFANTTVREFVSDIISDIKNTTLTIHPDKRYYFQTMEFMYLALVLYGSSLIYVLILIVFIIYFVRNYIC